MAKVQHFELHVDKWIQPKQISLKYNYHFFLLLFSFSFFLNIFCVFVCEWTHAKEIHMFLYIVFFRLSSLFSIQLDLLGDSTFFFCQVGPDCHIRSLHLKISCVSDFLYQYNWIYPNHMNLLYVKFIFIFYIWLKHNNVEIISLALFLYILHFSH